MLHNFWTHTWGGTEADTGNAVRTDPWESVFVTGGFRDNVDFDPSGGTTGHTSHGDGDCYLLKLTPDGGW
jgi:hypothetical protein